ncbi:uncharacterized protein LOC116603277 [Nematostella vectensis]|uniref:uncharacterized protein LOC116603277 n=1 Tax=Nematostella vectensis TaxID=45351 RepID=UPI0020775914|nr:uncharacterized protein LOC116603277 [Nematostella vectensis]
MHTTCERNPKMDESRFLNMSQTEQQAANSSLERLRRSIEGALKKEKQTAEKAAVNRYIRDASVRMELNLPIKPTKQDAALNNKKKPECRLPILDMEIEKERPRDTEENSSERLASLDTLLSSPVSESSSKQNRQNSDSTLKLPPIIIETGQRTHGAKRKRKRTKDEHKVVNHADGSDDAKKLHSKTDTNPSKSNVKKGHNDTQTKTSRKVSGDLPAGEGNCEQTKANRTNYDELAVAVRTRAKEYAINAQTKSEDEESLNVVLCGRSPGNTFENTQLFVSKHGRFKSK